MTPAWFQIDSLSGTVAFSDFLRRRRGASANDVTEPARAIVAAVRTEGAAAVCRLTAQHDRIAINPETLSAPGLDLAEAADQCPQDVRDAIGFAADRIARHHARQRPRDERYDDGHGSTLGWKWTPVDSVGLYVPGGRAAYPSTVLMNAIPAREAGVQRLAMVSPTPDGVLNPAVAFAAKSAGVTEFYPIGGAQAVAALAYGAGPLQPVSKIVGPGNAWVAAAKRLVFGDVGIDTIAGPSEICVVADNLNDPDWMAADLLSQAEHDPMAQSILVTDDADFAREVCSAVARLVETLATSPVATASWREHGAVVIAPPGFWADIVNLIAPEHVELAVADPQPLADAIRHAGAIFVGRHAPEALGDYVSGSNHVLPTSGAARFASGLGLQDFMKKTSIQSISPQGFAHLAEAAEILARFEGLPAHALSVSIRRSRA